MMHMTPELLERMAKQRVLKLSEGLLHFFKEEYPKECKLIGETNLKTFCTISTQKAYTYGAQNYGELKTYTHMAWILGIGFDDDPLYPWIPEILMGDDPLAYRLELLQDKIDANKITIGTYEQLIAYDQALNKLLRINFARIKDLKTYTQIVEILASVYPQRVEALGGKAILKENLESLCHQKTIRYNIHHPIGIFVYAALVFFLGHRVDEDPLYPWAKKYLNDEEPRMAYKLDKLVKVIEKRVRNLHRETEQTLKELS